MLLKIQGNGYSYCSYSDELRTVVEKERDMKLPLLTCSTQKVMNLLEMFWKAELRRGA